MRINYRNMFFCFYWFPVFLSYTFKKIDLRFRLKFGLMSIWSTNILHLENEKKASSLTGSIQIPLLQHRQQNKRIRFFFFYILFYSSHQTSAALSVKWHDKSFALLLKASWLPAVLIWCIKPQCWNLPTTGYICSLIFNSLFACRSHNTVNFSASHSCEPLTSLWLWEYTRIIHVLWQGSIDEQGTKLNSELQRFTLDNLCTLILATFLVWSPVRPGVTVD